MLTNSQKKALYAATDTTNQAVGNERSRRTNDEQLLIVIGKILSATAISGATNRWLYTWRKANVDGTASTPDYAFTDSNDDAVTGNALNVCEGGNTATRLAPGITVANVPTGFSVQPIEGYVILTPKRLLNGDLMWFFYAPNAIDGSC